jgi:hypothetical protein
MRCSGFVLLILLLLGCQPLLVCNIYLTELSIVFRCQIPAKLPIFIEEGLVVIECKRSLIIKALLKRWTERD